MGNLNNIILNLVHKQPTKDGETSYVYQTKDEKTFIFKSTKEPFVWDVMHCDNELNGYIDDILEAYVIQGCNQHSYKGGFEEAIKTLTL